MSGDRESTYSFEEALEKLEKEKMENKSKVLRVLKVLNKIKVPLLFLFVLVSLISLSVKLSALESEVESYQRKLTFHSRATSADNCQELQNYGFSTNGHFFIDPDGPYFGKPAFEVYCDFDKNITRVSPTSAKSQPDNSRLTMEYDDQLQSLIETSGMCYQHVSFDSDKCLNHNQFWWEDNRGVKHWFRDTDELKGGNRLAVKSVFLPIKAIGSVSPLFCKTNEGIVEDLVCSSEYFNSKAILRCLITVHHLRPKDSFS